jgi:hypothetical protein
VISGYFGEQRWTYDVFAARQGSHGFLASTAGVNLDEISHA